MTAKNLHILGTIEGDALLNARNITFGPNAQIIAGGFRAGRAAPAGRPITAVVVLCAPLPGISRRYALIVVGDVRSHPAYADPDQQE